MFQIFVKWDRGVHACQYADRSIKEIKGLLLNHGSDVGSYPAAPHGFLNNHHMFGYCYTQLSDVYQEQNGIYTFDRRSKFDLERLRRVQQRPAAIEQSSD